MNSETWQCGSTSLLDIKHCSESRIHRQFKTWTSIRQNDAIYWKTNQNTYCINSCRSSNKTFSYLCIYLVFEPQLEAILTKKNLVLLRIPRTTPIVKTYCYAVAVESQSLTGESIAMQRALHYHIALPTISKLKIYLLRMLLDSLRRMTASA